jgi:hypothetical protein
MCYYSMLVYKGDTPEEAGNWLNTGKLKMARKENLQTDNVPIIPTEQTPITAITPCLKNCFSKMLHISADIQLTIQLRFRDGS